MYLQIFLTFSVDTVRKIKRAKQCEVQRGTVKSESFIFCKLMITIVAVQCDRLKFPLCFAVEEEQAERFLIIIISDNKRGKEVGRQISASTLSRW